MRNAKFGGVVNLLTLIWPILKGGLDDLDDLLEGLGLRRGEYQQVLVGGLFVAEVVVGGVIEWFVGWLRGGGCN